MVCRLWLLWFQQISLILKLFRSDANVAETKVDLVDFKMVLLNNKQMPTFKGLFGMKLF